MLKRLWEFVFTLACGFYYVHHWRHSYTLTKTLFVRTCTTCGKQQYIILERDAYDCISYSNWHDNTGEPL